MAAIIRFNFEGGVIVDIPRGEAVSWLWDTDASFGSLPLSYRGFALMVADDVNGRILSESAMSDVFSGMMYVDGFWQRISKAFKEISPSVLLADVSRRLFGEVLSEDVFLRMSLEHRLFTLKFIGHD